MQKNFRFNRPITIKSGTPTSATYVSSSDIPLRKHDTLQTLRIDYVTEAVPDVRGIKDIVRSRRTMSDRLNLHTA